MAMRLRIVVLLGMIVTTGSSWSRPVDLSAPTGGVGAAGLYGNLELWQEVDGAGVQLDPESYLPFRYKFTSENSVKGILGPGFYVPMFEAKNVLIREQMMRAFLPCGKGLYMRRDSTDPNKFQTLDQGWTGYLMNDGEDFVIWRDDGWKLLYHKGRLASLTSDDTHVFTWSYDATGLPTGLSEDGQTLVSVESNAAGQVAAFIFSGKRYELTYAERPVTEMLLGQVAIKELDPALASLKYPDGKTDTFHFELTPDRVPTVAFINRKVQKTIYAWDPMTQDISTEEGPDGNWTYTVKASDARYGVPEISRTSTQHATESIAIDLKTGTYIRQSPSGDKVVTQIFETPGPLYQKVRDINKIQVVNGHEVATQIFHASYDEMGHMIRSVDEKGYITTYDYNTDGSLKNQALSLPEDPQIRRDLISKEKLLIKAVASANNDQNRQDDIRDLAQYYLFDMLNPTKALSFVSELDHSHSFIIRFQAASFDASLSKQQKLDRFNALIKDYPEFKDHIEFAINSLEGEQK